MLSPEAIDAGLATAATCCEPEGGARITPGPNRALTEIEQNVIDSVVKLLLDNLRETWRPVTEVQFKIQGRETRPQMLQVTGPNEIVILLVFDIRIAETRGMLNL